MEVFARELADYMSPVINFTIQTVASNLSSKNKDIYESACNVLDTFMEALGKEHRGLIFEKRKRFWFCC